MKLESDKIKLDNFIIEKSSEDDQEDARRLHPLWILSNLAVINTNLRSENPDEIIKKIELIFLLFKTAFTYCASYELFQIPHGGNCIPSMTKFISIPILNVYTIKKDEEEQLKKFCNEVYQKLPKDIVKSEEDYLIAYWRYYDSLAYSFAIERKITDIIMGLEALYSNETDELKYRVKMRIIKLFNLLNLGYDSLKMAAEIDAAYKIRNKYAHGAATANLKAKIDSEYDGGCNALFINVLDYLRKSIILMLFCGESKKKLIELIDNSLIDSKSEKKLKEILEKCKNNRDNSLLPLNAKSIK